MELLYLETKKEYEMAGKCLQIEDVNAVMLHVRLGLESILKDTINAYAFPYTKPDDKGDLEAMIDYLADEAHVFSPQVRSLMHKTRILSNKGAHKETNALPITMDDAGIAIGYLRELTELAGAAEPKNESAGADAGASAEMANAPLEDPPYYSGQKRQYLGKWAHCHNRMELMNIPEYVFLLRKAEQGDIQAMLDIASGFLSEPINWNANMLINMQPYRYNNKVYDQQNAYDVRYYYWVSMAAGQTLAYDQKREFDRIPWRYLATALYDAVLFNYINFHNSEVYYYVNYVDNTFRGLQVDMDIPHYQNQYEEVNSMFNVPLAEVLTYNVYLVINRLVRKFAECGNRRILSPVHGLDNERAAKALKIIYYCGMIEGNVELGQSSGPIEDIGWYTVIDRDIILSEDHYGQRYCYEMLRDHLDDGFCRYLYDLSYAFVNQTAEKARRQEHARKRDAEFMKKQEEIIDDVLEIKDNVVDKIKTFRGLFRK